MARVRRPRYLCFFFDDFTFLRRRQPASRLRRAGDGAAGCTHCRSSRRGDRAHGRRVRAACLHPVGPLGRGRGRGYGARAWQRKGVLLSDEDDGAGSRSAPPGRDPRETGWNLEAALYYFLSRWRRIDLRSLAGQDEASICGTDGEAFRRSWTVGRRPPAFASVAAPRAARELPLVERTGGALRRAPAPSDDAELRERRSSPVEELAVVLRYVFGYHGYAPLLGQVNTLKRTSPSGGRVPSGRGLPGDPAVDGLEPGSTTTTAQITRSSCMAPLGVDEARAVGEGVRLRTDLLRRRPRPDRARGAVRARVLEVPEPPKAFAALLMDAAHLSQTLYLVATELGLGAFVPQRSTTPTSTSGSESTGTAKATLAGLWLRQGPLPNPRRSIPLSSRLCRARPSWANPRR